jgi:TrmH family RNA methyltransferase
MERIASRHNPLVQRFRRLARAASTRPGNVREVLLDGVHLVEEALSCGLAIVTVAVRDDLAAGPPGATAEAAARRGARAVIVTAPVLAAMSPVTEPSGIVAIARHLTATLGDALERVPQLVLVLAGVQDPGNLGAIIRAADACGASGVAVSPASADPFGWKALRGSMGSAFRIPVAARQDPGSAAAAARERGLRIFAAVPRGGIPLPACDLRTAAAVFLGGEGAGLPDALIAAADERLTIPMRPPVDSLNVATAAAVIAYEAARQRREPGSARHEAPRGHAAARRQP